jgi:hypothetical protein
VRHPSAAALAERDAGRLAPRAAARLARHVAACAACDVRAARIASARAVFPALAAEAAPELRWDHIGARVHWVTSAEARGVGPRAGAPRRRTWALAGLGVVALATTLAVVAWPADVEVAPGRAVAPARVRRAIAASPGPAAAPAVGVITFVQGDARHGDVPLELDRPVRAGDVLATGPAARMVVQLGGGTGVALGPASRLEVRALGAAAIELGVVGQVHVEVAHRAVGQRFVVHAGAREVEVRGTRFAVEHHADRLAVACTRGLVAVRDRSGAVAVAAGAGLELEPGALIAHAAARRLDPARLATLERALALPLLPAWTDAESLYATSAALEVGAAPGAAVAIDGLAIGEGALRVRVMTGRHQVQVGATPPTWLDAPPGAAVAAGTPAAASPSAPAAPAEGAAARRARRAELAAALSADRRPLACLRPLQKRGLVEGSFATYDVGIDARGVRTHVNLVETNLPPELERCLRATVDEADLAPGAAAVVRFRLAF